MSKSISRSRHLNNLTSKQKQEQKQPSRTYHKHQNSNSGNHIQGVYLTVRTATVASLSSPPQTQPSTNEANGVNAQPPPLHHSPQPQPRLTSISRNAPFKLQARVLEHHLIGNRKTIIRARFKTHSLIISRSAPNIPTCAYLHRIGKD